MVVATLRSTTPVITPLLVRMAETVVLGAIPTPVTVCPTVS